MPTEAQMKAGYQGPRNDTIRTVIPSPGELAAAEPDVEVHRTAGGIEFVRTPESRFEGLQDYPWKAQYVDIDGLQMAYIDEGPRDGKTLLLLHGQPVWGYLYRRMIPLLLAAGHRVIAPDFIGFGRSDKPIDQRYHHFDTQVDNLHRFLDALALEDISLFCQDWGSVIGLTVAAERPKHFARILLTNGGLVTWVLNPFYIPEPVELDREIPPFVEHFSATGSFSQPFPVMFQAWINYTLTAERWNPEDFLGIQGIMSGRPLSEAELAGYAAPFPSLIYKAGPRTFPSMLCNVGQRCLLAWESLRRFDKPFLDVRGSRDTQFGTQELQRFHVEQIPGAVGQPHAVIDAGHFIQDNKGEEMAEIFNRFVNGS